MPKITEFGNARYLTYTRAELENKGLRENPNMWLGGGFRFCVNCQHHVYVVALSHPGKADCYEVCRECNTHNCDANAPIR